MNKHWTLFTLEALRLKNLPLPCALAVCAALAWFGIVPRAGAQVTETDGDWVAEYASLTNTPQAAFMARVGDIDNLGFGWPGGFDPFSGNSTPGHAYPWTQGASDPDGTDRIMVVSSYTYGSSAPCGNDGYVSTTSRPGNEVRPIVLQYNLPPLTITNAALQIFVDDFQPTVWCANYQVTVNGHRAPFLETVINQLNQTGPIGKLITVPVPPDFFSEVASGQLSVEFDDPTSGAGDGYAIDFIKLLVNASSFQTGGVSGHVTDAVNSQPIAGAQVASFGSTNSTDATGAFDLGEIPAGLALVQAAANGYVSGSKTVDVVAGTTTPNVNFALQRAPFRLYINRATITPPSVELRFFGYPSVSYTLQYSTNLSEWFDDESMMGSGDFINRTRPAEMVQRYWRARQNGTP